MNNVTLIGRLTKDPELKYSQSGKAFCKFTLAVTRDYNREEADFINCVAWEKKAENIAEYLRKGSKLAIQGRISVRSYEHNGETKWNTEIIVDKNDFLDSRKSGNNEYSPTEEDVSNAIRDAKNDMNYQDDDDFPF